VFSSRHELICQMIINLSGIYASKFVYIAFGNVADQTTDDNDSASLTNTYNTRRAFQIREGTLRLTVYSITQFICKE
jgi:hypothetical protein